MIRVPRLSSSLSTCKDVHSRLSETIYLMMYNKLIIVFLKIPLLLFILILPLMGYWSVLRATGLVT